MCDLCKQQQVHLKQGQSGSLFIYACPHHMSACAAHSWLLAITTNYTSLITSACPVGPRDRLRGLRPRPHWLSDQLGQWVGADLLESCERLDSSHPALDLHQQPNGAFKARPWESP